jgi:hypothetical protein
LSPFIDVQPTPGISNSEHHSYWADEAMHIGGPVDGFESEKIAWVPLAELRSLIDKGEISSGTTLAALLYVLSES